MKEKSFPLEIQPDCAIFIKHGEMGLGLEPFPDRKHSTLVWQISLHLTNGFPLFQHIGSLANLIFEVVFFWEIFLKF